MQPELEDILDTMSNESIVYDTDLTYFAEPFIEIQELHDVKVDHRKKIEDLMGKYYKKFYKMLNWKYRAWDDFKRWLIEGILAWEIVYDSLEKPTEIIGLIPIDPATLTKKYDNLLVVQTFSKSRSLAGARLGFAIANEEIIKDLEKIKYSTNPYNVNRLTQALGMTSVSDKEYFDKNRNQIIQNREYTITELKRLGFTVTDSKANFVFAASDKIDGESLYKELKDRGILVRHFSDKKISNYNRITIGTREEMEALIKAIEEIIL